MEAIDKREQTLTLQVEQTQACIDELTTTLGELHEEIAHLQITGHTANHRLSRRPKADP